MSDRRRKSPQRIAADKKLARKATQPKRVQKMLDAALEAFEPHMLDICKKLAEQAKASGGADAKFVVEFVTKYADRGDEREAREGLMELTRKMAGTDEYMPEGTREGIDADTAEQRATGDGDEEAPDSLDIAGLLASEADAGPGEPDLGPASIPVGAPQDS